MAYPDPFSDPSYQHNYYNENGPATPGHQGPTAGYGDEYIGEEVFMEKDYHPVGLGGQEYPPEPASASTFGFPAPELPPDNSAGGREATAKLYRTQTSAEAWSKRQKVNRTRAKTIKIKLHKGNFIHEYPVPTPIKHANLMGGHTGVDNEFTHMRYTAVTCDPDDFTREAGWSLRPQKYGRDIELLVAITYYNEDKVLVARTLHGVMTNLKDVCKAHWSEFKKMAEKGSPESGTGAAWKKIAVVLVFDGIEPADKAALDLLATLGVYQDGVMKKEVDGKETRLTYLSPHENDADNLVPVQMTFVLKQKNMFLAEDRILCFELVAKAKDKWVLGYVKAAKGETDVPESAAELIGSGDDGLTDLAQPDPIALPTCASRIHDCWVRPLLQRNYDQEAADESISRLIMSWFSLANCPWIWRDPYAAGGFQENRNMKDPFATPGGTSAEKIAWVTMQCWAGTVLDNTAHFNNPDSVADKYDWLGQLNYALKLIYLALVCLQIILALGNRPKGEKQAYLISLCIFASFAIYLLAMTLFLTVKAFCPIDIQLDEAVAAGSTNRPIFAGLAGTFGIYIVPLAYIAFYDPVLVHCGFIYEYSKWGTKGSDKAEALPSVSSTTTAKDDGGRVVEDIRRDQSELDADLKIQTRFIAIWLLGNAGIVMASCKVASNSARNIFKRCYGSPLGYPSFGSAGLPGIWSVPASRFPGI
ncbi:hypothetical protein PSHT_00497 [Puccinia striiformis]|uniref:Chitin synthase n=1 Tax=Puccinia striiformis TaxID=27350 RepID=A0A2S4WMS2_9BASI|nr:hypothetical protein PSHT_00497 [Puccinia striiformis]